MGVLMFGSTDSTIKKNLFVEFVYGDETVIVKEGEKFPRLGGWAQAEKINFSFCVSGDYDFKPEKQKPPTIKFSVFILNQKYMGQKPFNIESYTISEDGKKIHCVVSDEDTIKGIADWGCDWVLNNGLVPTPTEKPLKEFQLVNINLSNCTTNYPDGKILEGKRTIVITANSGYEFLSDDDIKIDDTVSKTFNEDRTICIVELNVTQNINVVANATKIIVRYSINYDLENATTNSPTTAIEGSNITIKVTADHGYSFFTAPIYNDNEMLLSVDKKRATKTFLIYEDINVVGKAEQQFYSYKENLINCAGGLGVEKVPEGKLSIILTANSGMIFTIKPYVMMNGVKKEFTLISKQGMATLDIEVTGDIEIFATAEKPKIYYTINENLTTVISDNTLTNIEENTEHTITYTAPSYNTLIEEYSSNIGSFTLSEDKTKLTLKFTATANINITVCAKIKSVVKITGDFKNCSCNYVDDEIYTGEKPILITADSGYTFKRVFNYKYGSVESSFVKISDTLIQAKPYEKGDDTIYLYDDYISTKEIEQVGTFVNLYKTNQTELTKLSKVRFSESSGQVTDYGSYINSLYILPFNIPSDILGDTSTILLGRLDSRVESTLIATYLFDIDGGSIEVPLKYDNIYDYVNTECILHLPFLDKVFLNSEYVIGQTLTITFTIELYSGNLTVNIVSSFNNEIVASVQGLIGMNIPFIQKSNGGVINSVSNVHKNMNKRCFVEVNRNIPYTKNNNVFGGSVVEYGKIGDYTGYLECDSLVLNTKATNQEQEEIKNIIRNGVFI